MVKDQAPRMDSAPQNPLAKLDRKEVVWLFGILKDACRERLERNLISQKLEDRLHEKRGGVPGRIDPRPRLKQWEPRYRKFLDVAAELHRQAQAAGADAVAEMLASRLTGRKRRKQDRG